MKKKKKKIKVRMQTNCLGCGRWSRLALCDACIEEHKRRKGIK
jgi:hypothetical protein